MMTRGAQGCVKTATGCRIEQQGLVVLGRRSVSTIASNAGHERAAPKPDPL
jgi:hypothetical protein